MNLTDLMNMIKRFFGAGKKAQSSPVTQPDANKPREQAKPAVEPKPEPEPQNTEVPQEVVTPSAPVQPAISGKKYLILREPDQSKQTLGTFTITEGDAVLYTCKTIELPWKNNQRQISCIPNGKYRTIRHRSPSYGECFWLQDVPGRSEILIHHGNYAASINPRTGTPDTKGCILPGQAHADVNADGIPDVTSSVNTMKKLREVLPDTFDLEIRTKAG
jgi:hypothetical protein